MAIYIEKQTHRRTRKEPSRIVFFMISLGGPLEKAYAGQSFYYKNVIMSDPKQNEGSLSRPALTIMGINMEGLLASRDVFF